MHNVSHLFPFIDRNYVAMNFTDFTNKTIINQNNFNFLLWNARSLNNLISFNKFKCLIRNAIGKLKIIALTETWFQNDDNKPMSVFNIPNFKRETASRTNSRGGGVALFIQKDINYSSISKSSDDFDKIQIKFMLNDQELKVVLYYRPPQHSNLIRFMNDIEMEMSLSTHGRTIIMGDINLDIRKHSTAIAQYVNLIEINDFQFANIIPTRPATNSLLDHVLVRNAGNFETMSTIGCHLSDHSILFASIKSETNTNEQQHHYKHISKTIFDFKKLRESFVINTDLLSQMENPNEILNEIYKAIAVATKQSCRTRRFKINLQFAQEQFINTRLVKLIRKQENLSSKILRLKYNNRPSNKLETKLAIISKEFDGQLGLALAAHYDKILGCKNIKKVWQGINKLIGREHADAKWSIEINGQRISDEETIANSLNHYFINCTTNPNVQIEDKSNKFSLVTANAHSMFLQPENPLAIAIVISQLQTSKAAGHDDVGNIILKNLANELAMPMSILINCMYATGSYPDMLKKGIVTPIPKSQNAHDLSAFRPITVLPNINTICEKLLLNQLSLFMDQNGYTDKSQFGFKKGSSTEVAVMEFLHDLLNHLDNGSLVLVAFLDAAKCFDSLSHEILTEKMEIMGVRGLPLQLIKSYLNNRMQAVKVGKSMSQFLTVKRGVPQGSSLAPFLFNLKMDDIKKIAITSKMIRFADDVCLYLPFTKSDFANAKQVFAADINTIIQFHSHNQLTINATKSKVMVIRSSKMVIDIPSSIAVETGVIPIVDSYKYLGIVIDSHLSMTCHIDGIVTRITPVINVLKKIKWYAPNPALLQLYHAHISSHLNYLASAYGIANETIIHRLQTLQNTALKNIFRLDIRHSTKDIYINVAKKKILPVKGTIFLNTVTFIYRTIRGLNKSNLNFATRNNNLRNTNDLIVHKFRNDFGKNNIMHRGCRFYNNLPAEIRNASSLIKFKSQVTQILFENIDLLLSTDVSSLFSITGVNLT
jgi:hypothetical protein